MNIYIDFDNTLFKTPLITKSMLTLISNEIIKKHSELNFDDAYAELKGMFNRENIYNIYDLALFFSKKYELDSDNLLNSLNNVISNTKDFLYDDSISFLKNLKEAGHKLYILSYCPDSLKYQAAKISGSGIADYFDALFITSVPKYELDINYKDGIFIDDNPSDLLGLYSKNPLKVIRIRRDDNKYSVKDIDNSNIIEFKTFKGIDINEILINSNVN